MGFEVSPVKLPRGNGKPRRSGQSGAALRVQKCRWFQLCLDHALMNSAILGIVRLSTGRTVPSVSPAVARKARAALYRMARASCAEFGTTLIGALYTQMCIACGPCEAVRTEHGVYLRIR